MTHHPELRATKDGVALAVHVQPGAGRTEVVGRHGDALKIRVAAPPVSGRANDAVIDLVAKTFDVKRDAVTVTSGATNRQKRLAIAGLELADAERLVDGVLDASPASRRP